jgi:hypothetical protein
VRALVVVLVLGLGPTAVSSSPPSRPPRALACRTTEDCGFTHFDEASCFECPATVGSRKWVESVEKVCSARADKGCRVPACGQANVRLACVSGQCVRR